MAELPCRAASGMPASRMTVRTSSGMPRLSAIRLRLAASVNGGRGTVAGTLLGVVLLGMIGPALTFLGISAYWERALQGAIILAAVAIDALRARTEKHAGLGAPQRA